MKGYMKTGEVAVCDDMFLAGTSPLDSIHYIYFSGESVAKINGHDKQDEEELDGEVIPCIFTL